MDNCLCAGCSILRGIYSADETHPRQNSCPEFGFLAFSLVSIISCRCHVKFSFLRSISLAVIHVLVYGSHDPDDGLSDAPNG